MKGNTFGVDMKVSIVIPVYNSEAIVQIILKNLSADSSHPVLDKKETINLKDVK